MDHRERSDMDSAACRQPVTEVELEALRHEVARLREAHARDVAALEALHGISKGWTSGSSHRRAPIERILRDPIR